jgi:tRNA A37 N6-isopentenylltransferase MiaA
VTDAQWAELTRRVDRLEELVAQAALPFGGAFSKAPKKKAPEPLYPWFSPEDRAVLYETWRAQVGEIVFSRLVKALAPLVKAHTVDTLAEAIAWYGADACSPMPEDFATRADKFIAVAALPTTQDKIAALRA